jgi:DNA-3-methyladenine glycosylase I
MSKKLKKCEWAGDNPLYVDYHDKEWGVPVFDDQKLFEFLILETFQAGLSWITVLRKRDNFRTAFDNFDYKKVALYDKEKISQLLNDEGIIRNRLKIYAAVSNARAFLEIRKEYGTFSKYIWSFTSGKPIINKFKTMMDIPANTGLSDKISKELKKKGFKFVGSTVIYAHMQATGMVNDHVKDCFRYNEINDL